MTGLTALGNNDLMEQDRGERQQNAWEMRANEQEYNSAEAVKARDYNTQMSNTAWQRGTADMQAAGINPMLAFMKGGASSPEAKAPTSGSSLASGAGYPDNNIARDVNSAAQAKLAEANAEKAKAEAESIREDIQTKPVTREQVRTQIQETLANIEKIRQDTNTSAYSAANLYANTQNLIELKEQIQATVKNIKALTGLAYTQTGKTTAEEGEIRQRSSENLPQAERLIKDIEAKLLQLQTPAAERSSAIYDTKVLGELAALIKAFAGLMPNIGIIMRPKR